MDSRKRTRSRRRNSPPNSTHPSPKAVPPARAAVDRELLDAITELAGRAPNGYQIIADAFERLIMTTPGGIEAAVAGRDLARREGGAA